MSDPAEAQPIAPASPAPAKQSQPTTSKMDTPKSTNLDAETEKKSYLGKYVAQSYKTPEEKEAQEAQAREESKNKEGESLRKFFHDNICQSIPPKTPPPKPQPPAEEVERKQKEEKNKKPFMERIKGAFRSGESKTNKTDKVEAQAEADEVVPVQGPDPEPVK